MQRSKVIPNVPAGAIISAGFFLLVGCTAATAPPPSTPRVVATTDVEAGRYIAIIGGCNDCHTANYLESEGKIPEDDWFTGDVVGWRGPWGTTYPSNLRLLVQEKTEDDFVAMVRTRTAMPPMPWMNVNKMHPDDVRALYRYLRSLGPKGSKVPAAVPPDREPETPYLMLEPQHLDRLESFLAKRTAGG